MNSSNVSGRSIIAGLFRDPAQGERALAELKAAGFTRAEISEVNADSSTGESASSAYARDKSTTAGASPGRSAAASGQSFFSAHDSSTGSFADELVDLGFSKRDAHDLVDGMLKGGALVSVDAGTRSDEALQFFSRYKADVRTAGSDNRESTGYGSKAKTDDEQQLRLRAEQLQVNKQRVAHGEVRLRKEVVTENQTIDVPVTREELVIDRHAVSGEAADDDRIGDSKEVRIPLSREEVDVSKRTVATEEVSVGKREVQGTEQVTDTVRHEELRVDDSSGSVTEKDRNRR